MGLTHKPGMRLNAISEEEMECDLPQTWAYLQRFEPILRNRGGWTVKQAMKAGRPFYSMSEIGDYTFAPWKVVWPNIASSLTAAVVGSADGRVVIPQHIVTIVATESEVEAHFICTVINSSLAGFAARAYSQEGGKSFGTPHILENIRIPTYAPKDPVHQALAAASQDAHEAAARSDEAHLRNIEAKIDKLAAQLWGLTDRELAALR